MELFRKNNDVVYGLSLLLNIGKIGILLMIGQMRSIVYVICFKSYLMQLP
jgi:hypothetical protein